VACKFSELNVEDGFQYISGSATLEMKLGQTISSQNYWAKQYVIYGIWV